MEVESSVTPGSVETQPGKGGISLEEAFNGLDGFPYVTRACSNQGRRPRYVSEVGRMIINFQLALVQMKAAICNSVRRSE